MRRMWYGALVLLAAPLAAQEEPPMREALVQQVMERFIENVRMQTGMTAEQAQRFRADVRQSFERRRELERRERDLWRALEGQMRPGVAADPDSVGRLLDGLLEVRTAQLEAARSEMRGYAAYLSPVQRAQVVMAWERLQRNIEDLLRRRMQRPGGPVRPGQLSPAEPLR